VGRLAVTFSVLAIALAAGCGGGGGDKLSHAEFVDQANAICADYNQRVDALGTPNSFDDIVAFAQDARVIAEEDVGKFKDLNPPDEDRDNWEAYGNKGDEVIALSRDLEKAAKDRDAAEVARLVAASRSRAAESKRIALAMGTAECAKT
jgi:hypothetical protein